MSSERVRRAGLAAVTVGVTVVLVLGLAMVVRSTSDGDPRGRATDRSIALASSVRVTAFGCSRLGRIGMGAMVDGGLIATVAHVVAGADEITVTTADGLSQPATVVAIDRLKDLALLTTDLDLPSLPLGVPVAGSSASYVVWRDDRAELIDTSIVRAVALTAPTIDHDATAERRALQIAAEVVSGDSGSIIVSDGLAVGMVFARSTQSTDRGWATDLTELSTLLTGVDADSVGAAVDVGSCT